MSIDPVSIAITIALTAAQMALTASRHIEGPRVKDLTASVADYGTPLNYGQGRFRVQLPVFFCEPIKEKKHRRKTKGGKYNEYTYYGTWANHIADQYVADYVKIWFDAHPIIDTEATGTQSIFALADDYELAANFRFYQGTETQDPDPRMETFIEAKEGVGTCPAYRGTSYFFWQDIPLEKIGNRFPQVSTIVAPTGGIGAGTSTVLDALIGNEDYQGFFPTNFSPDGKLLVSNVYRGIATLDQSDNHFETAFDPDGFDSYSGMAIDNDGTVYALWSGTNGHLVKRTDYARDAEVLLDNSSTELPEANSLRLFVMPDDSRKLVWAEGSGALDVDVYDVTTDTMTVVPNAEPGTNHLVQQLIQDTHGDIWGLGVSGSKLILQRVVATGSGSAAPDYNEVVLAAPGSYAVVEGYFSDAGLLVVWGGGEHLYLLDPDDYAVIADRAYASGGSFLNAPAITAAPFLLGLAPGVSSFWLPGPASYADGSYIDVAKVRASDLGTIASVPITDWPIGDTPDTGGGMVYSPYTADKLISEDIANFPTSLPVDVRYFQAISADVSLADIVRDVSERCGLVEGTDFDVSDIEDIPVPGYHWVQASGKDILAWLLDAYDVTVRPHDGIIEYIKKGGAPGTAIATQNFVPQGERFKLTTANDTDLPQVVFFSFADIDADHQPNSAKAQRSRAATDSRRTMSIDGTTLTLASEDAQPMADRLFRRRWFQNIDGENAVSSEELALEPGDVRPIEFDGITLNMECEKTVVSADGSIKCEWKLDDPALAGLGISVGAPQSGRPPSEIFAPGDSVGFGLDIPLIDDADDQTAPFLYMTGGPANGTTQWSGIDFFHSDTGETGTFEAGFESIGTLEGATWGTASLALPDAQSGVIDNGSAWTVILANGELDSITETQMLNDGTLNLAAVGNNAVGWEIIQFADATLTATNTYAISNRVRGARGTEYLTGGHGTNEYFVLLNEAKVRTIGAGELGDEDFYVAATAGRDLSSGNTIDVDFNGNAHRPYSPSHVTLTKSGNDWVMTGIRRTRIGGASLNGQDVPLGETSESWQMEIMDGADPVRTIPSTSLPITYTEDMQIDDFGSAQTTLTARLYQISPALSLRGFPTEVSA